MGIGFVITSMIIFTITIIIGSTTPNTWKWTGITGSLLMLGLVFFIIAMTIS